MNALKVKDELNRRGWTKFSTMSPCGQVCLNGAQLAAGLTLPERRAFRMLAIRAIGELFPDRLDPDDWYAQQYCNDHPNRTRADIDKILDRVAELEEACLQRAELSGSW